MEPSELGKIATWGMGCGASAMCTDFTKGSEIEQGDNFAVNPMKSIEVSAQFVRQRLE